MKSAAVNCLAVLLGGTALTAAPAFAQGPPAPAISKVAALSAPSLRRPSDKALKVSQAQDTSPEAAFPEPELRRSSDGVLDTTLDARIADNQVRDQVTGETRTIHTPTFEGTIPGPTLEVRPGDTLSINLVNDLPPNPPNQRGGFFPHDFHTLNLHTHGLQVSPLGISDNIFRMMPPGTANLVKVEIPSDHPSGTFWYHPHVHGTVTYQFVSGMAGFLIVKGGHGTLDEVPEVKAAKDVVMGFQVIRTDLSGKVPFVNEQATQFGTFPFGTTDPTLQGVWSTFRVDGAAGRSYFYFTTNGVTNPTLHMRPGEVQRWRLLDAAQGENLLLSLQGHDLNVVAMDGITTPNVVTVPSGTPLVLGAGQRYDVLVKAGAPGTYQLQALDPATPASVTPSGVDPQPRAARMSFDFPNPCSPIQVAAGSSQTPTCAGILTYPFPLATIVVDGDPVDMQLPTGPLPAPKGMPSMETMLNTTPSAERHVAFEICGDVMAPPSDLIPMAEPEKRPPSCGWYFAKYDAQFWGGVPFRSLEMMRDADDTGVPSGNPKMPLVDFKKDGLFNPERPLFDDMVAGNYEEWTVFNRSFSDHPFHIHQNHFLLTKINGKPLKTPEWHDTVLVPGSQPQPTAPLPPPPQPSINTNPIGSITFRMYLNPLTAGCFVTHCHILTHEDLGMMQRLDILPGPNQPSQCEVQAMSE
jgi:FtsP/CotA-like multicopper oxidase with cupredoxin domain